MKKEVKQERKKSTARDLGITARLTRSKAKAKAHTTVVTPDEKKPAPTVATKNPSAALPSDSVTTTEEVEIEEAIEEEEEEETPKTTVVFDDLALLTYDDDDKMNLEKGALVTMIGSITPNKDPTRRYEQKFQ